MQEPKPAKATFEVEVKRNGKWEMFESCEGREEAIAVAKVQVRNYEAVRVLREQWDEAENQFRLSKVYSEENQRHTMKKGWVVEEKGKRG